MKTVIEAILQRRQCVGGGEGGWTNLVGRGGAKPCPSSRASRAASLLALFRVWIQLVLYKCGFKIPPSENKAFAKLALKQSNQYYSNTMFRKDRITRQEVELHTIPKDCLMSYSSLFIMNKELSSELTKIINRWRLQFLHIVKEIRL